MVLFSLLAVVQSNLINTMNCPSEWPEPIVRVQSVAENCPSLVPARYVKLETDRPAIDGVDSEANIPVIDLKGLYEGDDGCKKVILNQVSGACREWGFFQILNHGISPQLLDRVREVWHDFFQLPMQMKQVYANSPKTYEGYGSRLGVEKGAILDWSDYYFLHFLPLGLKDFNKWPSVPDNAREVLDEYGEELVKLGGRLLKIMSLNLGLNEDFLQNAFGGEDVGACLRVNFYPKCPQPELTLGLSSHSDPGGMTLLLPDEHVTGLQVRKDGNWITVKPAPHAFIVNIGDQIQVLTNATYKSVEHRVTVNASQERVSLALFYNPKSNIPIEPAKELVTPDNPALYQPMTYDQYRIYIRMNGPRGKSQVESLKSPR